MEPFAALARHLSAAGVRFVTIGVAGANYYALSGSTVFTTEDRDLFLPPEPENELKAWQACESMGLDLSCGGESLDRPRDLWLAEQLVARRALVCATDAEGLQIDLTLVMAGFEFEEVWRERRSFSVQGSEIPVARLSHIVASKAAAGRDKDRLFLATHAEALRAMLGGSEPSA